MTESRAETSCCSSYYRKRQKRETGRCVPCAFFFVSARWSSSFPVRECVRGLLLPPLREEGGEEGGKHRERKKKRLLIFGFPPPSHAQCKRTRASKGFYVMSLSHCRYTLLFLRERERERRGGGLFAPFIIQPTISYTFFKKKLRLEGRGGGRGREREGGT